MKSNRILVTGTDGFIGSHLVEGLIIDGTEVKTFVNYNSFNTSGWLDTLAVRILEQIEVFAGDIRDPNGLRTVMKGVDAFFHLTALIAISFSYSSQDSYIDKNVKGILNIIQAAKDQGVERVLVTSTSEVYGTARHVPVTYDHPKQPQTLYSASKIGADCIVDSFFPSLDLTITIVQPFNTFGPRQSDWLR